ncbi:MAG: F0F1 ATP synthase subunit B [Bacillota bacterium]|nr:F0F1 ATP synthase subunit B [Bacillota bacterium]
MEILGLNLAEFIFAIVNFLLLLWLLKKFLYKPILKMLDDRKAGIDEALDQAAAAREEVAATAENLRLEIAKARAEAESIIGDARQRGEAARDEIVRAAREEAQALSSNALQQIEREKEKALADLKGQIADMAIMAAEKLLSEKLTAEQEQALLDKYVKEVGRLQ